MASWSMPPVPQGDIKIAEQAQRTENAVAQGSVSVWKIVFGVLIGNFLTALVVGVLYAITH